MKAARRPSVSASSRGFTLIELMIVVVIIGILAALAIPRFNIASMRAKEKEADGILKHVYTMQQAYYSERGSYATTVASLETVGFLPPAAGQMKYYNWVGDANVGSGACLQPNGNHSGRAIDFVIGEITAC